MGLEFLDSQRWTVNLPKYYGLGPLKLIVLVLLHIFQAVACQSARVEKNGLVRCSWKDITLFGPWGIWTKRKINWQRPGADPGIFNGRGGGGWCQSAIKLPGSPSIKIGIDLSIEKSIKIGKSDLIDIDCIDQSIEIDDTLVSFIDSSRFYRFHRFIWEHASVLLFIQKWKLISCKQWIYRQLSCNWESKDQTIITLKKVFFCLADID